MGKDNIESKSNNKKNKRKKKTALFTFKVIAAALVVAGVGVNADAVTTVTEKALSGISVSLSKLGDNAGSEGDQNKTKTATEKAADTASGSAAGSGTLKESLTSEKNAAAGEKESADKKADKDKESKKDKKKDKKKKEKEKKEKEKEKQEKALEELKLNLDVDRLGIPKVTTYLNIRKKPNESSKIVGKLTKRAGCNIYNVKKGWAKIVSGDVKGYVKAKYLYKDQEAVKRAKKVATLRTRVHTQTLNVRFLPSKKARIYDQISGEDYYDVYKQNITKKWLKKFLKNKAKHKDKKLVNKKKMLKDTDNWMAIAIDEDVVFLHKDYCSVGYRLDRAVSMKDINAKKAAKKAARVSKGAAAGNGNVGGSTSSGSSSAGSSSSGSSSSGSSQAPASKADSSIVGYAMQFLGNPYVWGGTSLTNGCDCSGFTMGIWSHFGHSLAHSSAAQAASTTTISYSQAKPGDLFFYGSGGSVSHVAMYIGGGRIIHASNHITGIIISNANYRTPIKIGRVG